MQNSENQKPTNPFGEKIPLEKAQRMYKSFYKVKQRAIGKIKTGLSDDSEASRYHSGMFDSENACCFLDMAFIFDAQNLRPLVDNNDGIIIFLGTRDMTDSEIIDPKTGAGTGQYSDVDGRPTLLVFPYKYESSDAREKLKNTTGTEMIDIALDEGLEHPGTGGGSNGGGGGGSSSFIGVKTSEGLQLPIPGELPSKWNVRNLKSTKPLVYQNK